MKNPNAVHIYYNTIVNAFLEFQGNYEHMSNYKYEWDSVIRQDVATSDLCRMLYD